ncbi:Hypothetical protein PHPALM_38147, partial [Phytophthora palmivora]
MPFGLKNAPMIYQRMIDNALWGFVQPMGGWSQVAKAMRDAEEQTKDARTVATEDCNQHSEAPPRARTNPTGDMFANGESDESSLVPVFDRRSFVDDICFGNETFDGCLATLDRLLQHFTECRISVSFTKSIFVQSKVDFLSHEVSPEGIRANPKKIKAVTEIPFPTSKKGVQSFLGALNYYSRFIQDFAVYGAALYQLKDADFAPGGDLTVAKRSFAALQQKVRDAPILRHFDRDKEVHVMLFANEAHDRGLAIVGDSRLAIQQSLGVIACLKESLLTQLNHHRELTAKFQSVKYLHVVREFNAAADSLASETLESKISKVVSTEARLSELVALNRIQDVIYEPTAKAETEYKPSVNTVRTH